MFMPFKTNQFSLFPEYPWTINLAAALKEDGKNGRKG
jgi:hypothetical protein